MRKSSPRKFILPVLVAATFVTQVFLAAGAQQAQGDNNLSVEFMGEAAPPDEPLSLWYRRPAKEWVEALPVGNGRLGAMAFGGVTRERLQLNEDTLWAGGPYDPNNPDARAEAQAWRGAPLGRAGAVRATHTNDGRTRQR